MDFEIDLLAGYDVTKCEHNRESSVQGQFASIAVFSSRFTANHGSNSSLSTYIFCRVDRMVFFAPLSSTQHAIATKTMLSYNHLCL